jgi:PKHD-type hydroxylase
MYQFLPAPDYVGKEENWVYVDNVFSNDELKKIRSIGDKLGSKVAEVGRETIVDKKVRSSKVSWIGYDKKTEFIYRKLGDVVVRVNALHFGFNLTGFVEHFQYTSYGSNNDHYEWHMDKGPNLVAPRKLSLVLMLSDPNEYEGGELEFLPGMNVTVADNKLGRIFLFPSWLLHRVTPVTKGIRKTLVVWVSGPKFA